MPATPDLYDLAVEHFTDHPDEIRAAWEKPVGHKFGYLFGFLNTARRQSFDRDNRSSVLCGCPSQVKGGSHAETKELTAKITEIAGLPITDSSTCEGNFPININNLQFFAEAQRIADTMLQRPLPTNWR